MKNISYPYLNDKTFLKNFDKLHTKEQFVKMVCLTWNEEIPIGEIQGYATSGSININGSSSVRRTASMNIVADDTIYDILNVRNLISINKKLEIEVGFLNNTKDYPDYPIIWFPQGVYVIKSASVNHNNSGVNISVSLSDKMCLLNGDCGGTLPAAVSFDKITYIDTDDKWTEEKQQIYSIIQRAVHEFGGEDLGRIIINDVPNRIKKVMKWVGDTNISLCRIKSDHNAYNKSYVIYTEEEAKNIKAADEKTGNGDNFDIVYTYYYGDDVGYVYSDFYYPNDLSCTAGEAVTTVLDKIKDVLGNFEYFYDLFGNFVFQEIRNYLNTTQTTFFLEQGFPSEKYLIDRKKGKSVYEFDTGELVISYSNAPQFNNIKNDYVIWGQRKDKERGDPLILYHLAIDSKPKPGNKYAVILKKANISADSTLMRAEPINLINIKKYAFETIGENTEYNSTKYINNITRDNPGTWFYLVEKVGDNVNQSFHRYDPKLKTTISYYDMEDKNIPKIVQTTDWREELYYKSMLARELNQYSFYYEEMAAFWPRIFNPITESISTINDQNDAYYNLQVYKGEYLNKKSTGLDFYIDFIDSTSPISDFSVKSIGRRSKVVTDTKINCLFASDIPNYILIKTNKISGAEGEEVEDAETAALRKECEAKGQPYIQVTPELYAGFATGGSMNPAYTYIQSLLHKHLSFNEKINLSTIPIYYLEPNTRITVSNKKASIQGDYMIGSISLPLDTKGSMSLSCTKTVEKI